MKASIQPTMTLIRTRLSAKKGQTLVEYALVLAVMSVILIVAFGVLSSRIIVVFSAINAILDTAQNSH